MEDIQPADAGDCSIGYSISVYGNGNPNSTTTGVNFSATVAIGNKNGDLKAQRTVTVSASSGTGWYGTSVPTTTAWYRRWTVINSISYSQTIEESISRYNLTDSKGATHATGGYLSNLKGTWYQCDVGNSTAGATFNLTIYYAPVFTVNLKGGTGPSGWTGPGITAASSLPTRLFYNSYDGRGSTAFPSATIYAKDPATMGSRPNATYDGILKPQRTGYTFNGYYSATGGYQVVSPTGAWSITRDSHLCKAQTLYAHWTANKYNLTANANGGSIPSTSGWSGTGSTASKSVTFDSSPGTMPKPTRTGYTLAGWYTATSGGTKVANADGSFISTVGGYTNSGKWKRSTTTTLYAQWTANHYTITADANGGTNAAKDGWTLASDSKTSTMSFTYDQAASAMPIASRTGYTLNGWYTATSGGTKVANADGSFIATVSGYTSSGKWVRAAATTLYAHWTANHYTITADANGGTNAAKDGWTLASDKKTSTMSFTYGQAASAMPSVTAPEGKRRTINGWYTAASGGTKVADSNGAFLASISGYTDASKKWVRASNTTLYAQYSETILTIRYHLNGGTDVESDANFTSSDPCRIDQWNYSKTTTYGLTNCTDTARVYRTGYTASVNYNTKADKSGKDIHQDNLKTTVAVAEAAGVLSTLKTQDTTIDIYMIWNINSYTLKIEPNNGTYDGSTSLKTISQNYNTSYTFKTPSRAGHTFNGWSVGRNLIGASKTFDGSSTFVSLGRTYMYTDKIYVTVRASMSTWADYKTSSMRLISCTEGGGWNFEPNGDYVQFACYDSGKGYKVAKASVRWADLATGYHTFSGSFDGSYARVYVDGILVGTSEKYTSGAIGYHASNGIFVGAEAATTTTTPAGNYFNGTIDYVTIVNSATLTTPSTFTFPAYNSAATAQWTINSYTLTANANSGSIPSTTGWTGTGATATKTVAYNAAYGTLPTPTKTGYGFVGWYTAATGGTKIDSTTKMGAANATIYAHWSINSYTLTANCNGGSAPSTLPSGWTANGTTPHKSLNYNVAYGTLPEPTRQGYIFAGWFTAASGGSEVNSSTKIGAANATIYARWEESWVKYMSDDNPVQDQADGYYKIDSAEKLARLAYLVNYNIDNGKWASYKYKQTADINLSAHYWQPIGNTTYQFKGTYDGTTFDIHNMKTYCGANEYEAYNGNAMFSLASGSGFTIKNVNNYDVNITGKNSVGGIATSPFGNITIQNCRVSGIITGITLVGGIAGFSSGRISDCENYATVSGSEQVGGLAGCNRSSITNCVNYGIVKGNTRTGGLVGDLSTGTINGCVNQGNVTGQNQTGGIAGIASYGGTIQSCVNDGTVQGTTNVGGIVGYTQSQATKIEKCLNDGTIKATAANGIVGGIVGQATYATTITSSFVDCDITPVSTSKVGGIVGYATVAITITYCGANVKVTVAASTVQPFYNAASGVTVTCNDSYSLVNNNGTKINRITATNSGMDKKFGMISSIHDGLPVPLGIYHVSQYGTTTGIASTLKGSKYGCTTA